MSRIVSALAVILTGLYAGALLFHAIAPSTLSLPAPAYLASWQGLNHDYRVLPPFLIFDIVLLVLVAVAARRRGVATMAAATAATLLVAGSIVVTVTQMVPLNELANGWTAETLPADFDAVRRQWWSLHLLRTVGATAGFVLLVAALLPIRTAQISSTAPAPAEAPVKV